MKKIMDIAGWGCTISFYAGTIDIVFKEIKMSESNLLLLVIFLIFIVCGSVYIYGMIKKIKSFLITGPKSFSDVTTALRKLIEEMSQERRELMTANNNHNNGIARMIEKIEKKLPPVTSI